MKTLLTITIASGLAAGSAYAQNSNPCPGEKSYQVNIIGVPKGKNPSMTSGNRIFVPLTGSTKIYMTGDTSPASGLQCGTNFYVADANGTDGSATLVVPCTNVNATSTAPGACFDVFITALGKPTGSATVDVVCTFDSTVVGTNIDAGTCATGNIDFSLAQRSGKPVQQEITNFLRASGCFDTNANGTCDSGEKTFNNIWIFNLEALVSYYWDYTNDGLRLSQVRFCESASCGGFGVQP